MKAGRTTNIASIIPLLGAFVGAAVVMGLLGAGLIMPTVGAAAAKGKQAARDPEPDESPPAPEDQGEPAPTTGTGI